MIQDLRLDYTLLVRSRRDILLASLIAVATIGLYWQAASFGFVNYDDHRYVYDNPRVLQGLSLDSTSWAFSTFEFSNWHPLTWLSLMLDASLHAPANIARGCHITNILLHALNAALVMLLLFRLTGAPWRSAMAAALFAMHPLHVESVAWVSERKDVLSTFFGLLAMLAYVWFARETASDSTDKVNSRASQVGRKTTAYALMILCFAMSLMSKPMFVTLPFLLLVIDWWPLNRMRSSRSWFRLVLEKTPLLVMSVASCVLTILAQHAGGAMRDLQHVSYTQRIANAIVAYGEYLRQAVWPSDLAVFYPYPTHGSWPAIDIAVAALALVIISIACAIAFRRRLRAPLAGWLWFLGTLIPVIGLVQVGAQSHADRYTYFPLIGVFVMFAWSLPAKPPGALRFSIIAAASCVIALMAVCWVQISFWRDSTTLALRALDVTDDNFMAHILLGNTLVDAGEFEQGAAHLQEATRIEPTLPQAWHNLGFALAQLGMNDDAMQAYRTAIAQRPDFAENHFNLGLLLQAAGKNDDAQAALRKAAELARAAGDAALAARADETLAKSAAH